MPTSEYSGADATDVQLLMRELQNHSSGVVKVIISAPSDKYSGSLDIAVQHTFPHLRYAGKPATDTEMGTWPNRQSKTFESAIYWLVYNVFLQYDARQQQLPLDL